MKLVNLLIATFLLTAGAAKAVDVEQSAHDFMQEYISTYNTYLNQGVDADISLVTANFAEPMLQVPAQGAPVVARTRADLNVSFGRFLEFLQGKGARTLEWRQLQLVPLGENKAFASGVASIRDGSGAELEQRSSLYSLYKSDRGWKITMLQSHPLQDVPILKKSKR